ncbi:MAG TPA: hypothetical protein PKV98_04650 [Burkholderiaceae bacterium]|nr:hypothetical protein [Burkholderiaceae bacterium]
MNKQRGFLEAWAIKWIAYGVIALVIAGLIGVAVYKANHWCNTVCKDERAARIAAEQVIKEANAETQRIRIAWAQESVEAQKVAIELERKRRESFKPIRAAAQALPPAVSAAPFDGGAARVLRDAIDAANAAVAPTPPGAGEASASAASAPSTVGAVTEWSVSCADQYSEVASQLNRVLDFYENLRAKSAPLEHTQ